MLNSEVTNVVSGDPTLATSLLDGQLIIYHDEQYEVTAAKNEMLMKLYFDKGSLVIFYIQVPYGYPIPDGLKTTLKIALGTALKKSNIDIEFINAATEAQKRDMNFRIKLSGECVKGEVGGDDY